MASGSPTELAIARLADLLRHADDLNFKIDIIRKRTIQEKASVDAQLTTDVEKQFADVQEGLRLLHSTKDDIARIKQEIAAVDQVCVEAQELIDSYDVMKQVRAHTYTHTHPSAHHRPTRSTHIIRCPSARYR